MIVKQKPTAEKTRDELIRPLIDPAIPIEHRLQFLAMLCADPDEANRRVVTRLLEAAAETAGASLVDAKTKELHDQIEALKNSPYRGGSFLRLLPGEGPSRRAEVVLNDGQRMYTVVPDPALAAALRCGDSVLLDAQAKAILFSDTTAPRTGEIVRFRRALGNGLIEVRLRDFEPHVYQASAELGARIEAGEVAQGAELLACPRRSLAFDLLAAPEGSARFRYLLTDPPPDVLVGRDVGNPPPYIDEMIEHFRIEMEDPALPRRYRLRRAHTRLLTGVSGTGKTLSIHALWRRMYELMSEVLNVPIEALPQRVLRLRLSEILSKWLGESDKRLDQFFDEVEAVAAERYTAPDGKQYELPTLVICEEVDGLARARGSGDDVYDRIQTTALQRLDAHWRNMKDRLILFVFTTNIPQHVDPAFLRRSGGMIIPFGRLDRRAFVAVLEKHLRGLPVCEAESAATGDASRSNGRTHAHALAQRDPTRRLIADVTDWLYSPNGPDAGQVELTYVGSAAPAIMHRRDFLTGSIVDQAVQLASAEACRHERRSRRPAGLTTTLIERAIARQVHGIVDQLTPHNAGNYLTLPDGERVTHVRRLKQPALLSAELELAS
jgi:proteasome-associated ATPase